MPTARTSAQLEGSCRNGARSKGPVTPEGKERASRNALQHGLTALHHPVLDDEVPDALDALIATVAEETGASTEIESRLARRLGALVNILPLHPGGAPDLTPTAAPRIRAFADRLRNQGIEATVRRSRGLDINAACGQLRVEVDRKRAASRWLSPSPRIPPRSC